jgi:formate hydrogenlyase subunit 6/NADH:ubiquinone oxidoreductase subunit I
MKPMNMEAELLRHIIGKPMTVLYPFETNGTVKGLRGRPQIDMAKCVGCGICARGCPGRAMEMEGKGSESSFRIHLERCLFCGQCAESCPKEAIQLTTEYELATAARSELVLEFERPLVEG